jgi:hypothetical protein
MTNPLLQKLQNETDRAVRKCKYATILAQLDIETQDFIEERMSLPFRHPHKLSYAILSKVLKSEQHQIGTSTISDHYNKICGCSSSKEETK